MGSVKRVRIELDRATVLSVAMAQVSPHVAETTRMTLNRAKVLTPVRTGNLRASERMTMRVRRTYVAGTVETKVKYAHFVHEGTKAHLIRARRRKFLKFTVGDGQVMFRKVVRHPGTRPRPFLRQALYDVAEPRGYKVTGGATGYLFGAAGP